MGWDVDRVILKEIKTRILGERFAGCSYSMATSYSPVIIAHRGVLEDEERKEIVALFPDHIRVEFQPTNLDFNSTLIYGRGNTLDQRTIIVFEKNATEELVKKAMGYMRQLNNQTIDMTDVFREPSSTDTEQEFYNRRSQPMSNVGLVVQARMSSSRFPGKVLADIDGKPMIERVIKRLFASTLGGDIILAIPDTPDNEVLINLAERLTVKYFEGSPEDVLSRYYDCATMLGLEVVVRVTGDCPLIDPTIVNTAFNWYLQSLEGKAGQKFDYVFTTTDYSERRPNAYPDGMDVEVISYAALEKCYKEATDPLDREHVTRYILTNPDKFQIGRLTYHRNLPEYHWSVNTEDDLEFVRHIYRKLGDYFTLEDILKEVEGEN